MNFDIVFCGRRLFTQYAQKKYGWLPGSRTDHIKFNGYRADDTIHFLDAPFKDWENQKETFFAAVKHYHPRYIVVPDIYTWDVYDERIQMGYDFLAQGIENVIIVPKVASMNQAIPDDFIVGWPVGSKAYSDVSFDEWELFKVRGRRIHLLGSGPRRQASLAQYHNVVSLDGNGFVKAAQKFRIAYGPRLENIDMSGDIHSNEIVFCSIDGIAEFWNWFKEGGWLQCV